MIDPTNADLLEALSTRYVAPRILMLSSGIIALIPMMGKGEIHYISPSDFSTLATVIPTADELALQHDEINRNFRTKPPPSARTTPTLDELI